MNKKNILWSVKSKLILFFKMLFYIFSIFLAFWNFSIFVFIIFLVNIPILRKSIFGRLPNDPKTPTWKYAESVRYTEKNSLDIFYPDLERLNLTKFKGIVVFAHGGGWISGYRRQPNNISWYRYLVSKGFIVATIDYTRGYKAGIEKLIDELIEAVDFVMKKFENQHKIALMGLSAGGHLALLTASRIPEKIERVVSYYAPCDLLDIWESPSLFARFASATTLKRLPRKSKEVYEKYSPVNNIPDNFPKTLLVHGLRDTVVPYVSSVKMFKKLREKKIPSKLLLHPYGSHGFEFVLRDEKTLDMIEKTAMFLEGDVW